jgi:hypothetical protein
MGGNPEASLLGEHLLRYCDCFFYASSTSFRSGRFLRVLVFPSDDACILDFQIVW